jgi:hypothetical protein
MQGTHGMEDRMQKIYVETNRLMLNFILFDKGIVGQARI